MKELKGSYETKVDETVLSDTFAGIEFVNNNIKYVKLRRQRLLDAIITNMKLRLMDSDEIRTDRDSIQNDNKTKHRQT